MARLGTTVRQEELADDQSTATTRKKCNRANSRASCCIVRTKFLPSPITHDVRCT